MITMKPNFFSCLLKLQAQNGRVYSWQDVGQKIGLSRQATHALFTGKLSDKAFIKYTTLGKLIEFFESEGMPVTPNDLFVIARSE